MREEKILDTPDSPFSNSYKWYVLLLLTGVYSFNFIDRQLVVILAPELKKPFAEGGLGLSDTDIGLLTGLAFAAIYVILGIPIARYADRSNRKNIVSISLAFWSLMTAISGFAQNFFHLVLARIGVGVGEAGGSPPSHSIISDYFPPEKRGTALSVYSMGVYIGVLLGFLIGGFIAQRYGWRYAFFALGIPGMIYAAVLYFTVKEPPKGMSDKAETEVESASFWEVMKLLFSKKTFVYIALGSGLHTFMTYGVGNHFPSFLAGIHEMPILQIGIALGLTAGFGGMIGTFMGGYIADRMREKDIRWYLWISIVAGLIHYIPGVVIYFSPNTTLVIVLVFFSNILSAMYLGPTLAVTHSLVNAKMRALASAVLFFILNLIGLGFGPLAIGMVSDWLAPTYGVESLRWAFCITFITGTISIYLYYLASKHYVKDLENVA